MCGYDTVFVGDQALVLLASQASEGQFRDLDDYNIKLESTTTPHRCCNCNTRPEYVRSDMPDGLWQCPGCD